MAPLISLAWLVANAFLGVLTIRASRSSLPPFPKLMIEMMSQKNFLGPPEQGSPRASASGTFIDGPLILAEVLGRGPFPGGPRNFVCRVKETRALPCPLGELLFSTSTGRGLDSDLFLFLNRARKQKQKPMWPLGAQKKPDFPFVP